MDKNVLVDLQELSKALKATITRSQNGIAGLINISKIGPTTLAASAPNILAELRQLEADAQRLLKSYRDQLNKAALAAPTTAVETETKQ